MEDDVSPVLEPKKEAPNEKPAAHSAPLKVTTSESSRGTPSTSSKSSKGERKFGLEESRTNGAPLKKVKTENEVKSVKDETSPSTKSSTLSKGASPRVSLKTGPAAPSGPVTEGVIRDVLVQKRPVTTQDLVAIFKSRLKLKEDKDAFAAILRRIIKIQKT